MVSLFLLSTFSTGPQAFWCDQKKKLFGPNTTPDMHHFLHLVIVFKSTMSESRLEIQRDGNRKAQDLGCMLASWELKILALAVFS
jgi:hypothetical protein